MLIKVNVPINESEMQIEVFKLKFLFDHFNPPLPAHSCSDNMHGNTPIQAQTRCQIHTLGTEPGGTPTVPENGILTGESFCHQHDEFRKSVGRKIALTNALDLLEQHYPEALRYHVRKSFWDQYHAYTRGTKRKHHVEASAD